MKKGYDYILIYICLALLVIGWIMVYSSSAVVAEMQYHDSFKFLKRQLLFSLIGLIGMVGAMKIDYRRLSAWTYPILVLSFLLLIVVLIPALGLSLRVGVARRWLMTPWFAFQPSELGKLALVIFLAYALTKKGDKIKEFLRGFLPVIAIAGVMVLLVILEPDMGTAILMGILTMVLLFIGGTRFSYLLALPLLAAPALYLFITRFPYGYRRLIAFLHPWEDMQGMGFQIVQSFVALGSGGPWGVGLGDGKQKLFFLPAAHTDFILAILGEEAGFIGIMVVIILFALLIWRGVRISLRTADTFGAHLAVGLICLIALQVIINMGVVLGLLPTKGLTLPFISYGGTSLVANLVGVGLLLSISASKVKE
ncbi:MAG: cell division protein FtsW [Deltaproteobacteria bacterium RBG_16_54_11]|jgi:cell division protein FtsW|nr:MAG: cell division protein FtsW [Deltaproteobacteria bacterium RBG_16_54_11]